MKQGRQMEKMKMMKRVKEIKLIKTMKEISSSVRCGNDREVIMEKRSQGRIAAITGALALSLMLCSGGTTSSFADQTDMSKIDDIDGHWAHTYIVNLMEKQVVGGYPDNSFRPDNTIKVSEFTTILINNLKLDVRATEDGELWFTPFTEMATEAGIIEAGEYDTFERNITRGEMARMIVRAGGLELSETEQSEFIDDIDFSAELKPYIITANENGIISGYPDGSFGQDKTATRAESTVMITKLNTLLAGGEEAPVEEEEVAKGVYELWTDEEFELFMQSEEAKKYTDVIEKGDPRKDFGYYIEDGKVYWELNDSDEVTDFSGYASQMTQFDGDMNRVVYDLMKTAVYHAKESEKYIVGTFNESDTRPTFMIRAKSEERQQGSYAPIIITCKFYDTDHSDKKDYVDASVIPYVSMTTNVLWDMEDLDEHDFDYIKNNDYMMEDYYTLHGDLLKTLHGEETGQKMQDYIIEKYLAWYGGDSAKVQQEYEDVYIDGQLLRANKAKRSQGFIYIL